MKAKWWGVLLVAVMVVFAAGDAYAQRRGGSFGGGSFSRRSSSSGSSGSSGSSWGGGGRRSSSSGTSWGGSNNRRPSYGSSRGGGCGIGGVGGLMCCFMFFGVVVLFAFISKKKKGGSGATPGAPAAYHGPDAMYVTRLSLGVDWRARRELQATLQHLATTGDTSSPEGLAHLLRETVLALRRSELSWLYIGQETLPPQAPQNAEGRFHQMASAARSAFQTEMVRGGAGGVQTQDAPAMQANKNDGEGTVVVHLIIASFSSLPGMSNPDANQIRQALDARGALTSQTLAALEVVWSPADENDRMSTAELEQFYPDMALIDPTSIAGRLFCQYCRGPFAMELLNCPHCGAPAAGSANNRAPT